MVNGTRRLQNTYVAIEIAKIGKFLAKKHYVWWVFIEFSAFLCDANWREYQNMDTAK